MNSTGSCPCGNVNSKPRARFIEGIDLAAIPVHHYDGRAL